jgi:hypothetical protein
MANPKYLLMKNPYELGQADLLELSARDVELIIRAVSACTPSGGGGTMNNLRMKLLTLSPDEGLEDLSKVWDMQLGVYHEVKAFIEDEFKNALEEIRA